MISCSQITKKHWVHKGEFMMSRKILTISFLIFTVLSMSACGVAQKSIKLTEIPRIETKASKNITINIKTVTDSRSFVFNGDDPSIPQLATVKKITPNITTTAVAQVRNLAGTTVMDIFTERKVVVIVKEAVEESFKRAGYTITDSATDATPVDVNIVRFWAYNTGSWVFKFDFNITVELSGDLPVIKNKKTFSTDITLSSGFAAGPHSFRNTISKGMDKFIRELTPQLE